MVVGVPAGREHEAGPGLALLQNLQVGKWTIPRWAAAGGRADANWLKGAGNQVPP